MTALPLYKRIALEIAAELTEHPERWTQGALFRDAHGLGPHEAYEESAVCWCLMGHINKRTDGSALKCHRAQVVIEAFRNTLQQHSLANFNDSRKSVQEIIEACSRVAGVDDKSAAQRDAEFARIVRNTQI
jgi:hypothetical protein